KEQIKEKCRADNITKQAVIDSANPRLYDKETVYKFSFLIGSGHFLHCLSLSDFRLPRHKQCSSMSIPKSNSKIVLLSLLILYTYKPKAQDFFAVQGGFQICAAWRTNGTRASKFENNAVIRKKDKPLHTHVFFF
ncbi:MAG: hypothetical protein J6K99_07425, partial [Peptococcaceae bacterium]|nr:hypothetical protein [Peptococcaceae bacterium]